MRYSTVLICVGISCSSRGSIKLKEYFIKQIKERKLEEYVKIIPNGCYGLCQKGPTIIIIHETLGMIRYVGIQDTKGIDEIIEKTIINEEIVNKYYIEQHIRED